MTLSSTNLLSCKMFTGEEDNTPHYGEETIHLDLCEIISIQRVPSWCYVERSWNDVKEIEQEVLAGYEDKRRTLWEFITRSKTRGVQVIKEMKTVRSRELDYGRSLVVSFRNGISIVYVYGSKDREKVEEFFGIKITPDDHIAETYFHVPNFYKD